MSLNAAWHESNPMPPRASLKQRIEWHMAHAKACGCRAIPQTVAREAKGQGSDPTSRRS
jgi:hypothetical protein